MAEASEILGVTVEAVRGRIKRGTLEHERDSGTVYVLLHADQMPTGHQPDADQPSDRLQSDSGALTSELRDRLRYVEGQLEAERQAHAEARRIIAGLVERMPPAIEAPTSEASPPEARESPESPGPSPTSTEGSVGQEATAQPRPWWRRMFGGQR